MSSIEYNYHKREQKKGFIFVFLIITLIILGILFWNIFRYILIGIGLILAIVVGSLVLLFLITSGYESILKFFESIGSKIEDIFYNIKNPNW